MMRGGAFYKDDTVCCFHPESKRAFIGTVEKSDNVVPQAVLEDLWSTNPSIIMEGYSTNIFENCPAITEHQKADDVNLNNIPKVKPDLSISENAVGNLLPKIYVNWTSLTTGEDHHDCPLPHIMHADQLTLLERVHMPDDLVRHAHDDRVGHVVSVRLRGFAQLLSYGRVLFNLDCNRLRSVVPWSSGTDENYVIWSGWLGRVVSCHMVAIVRFTDGARLLVHKQCLHDFEPVSPTSMAFPEPYFEGAWLRGDARDLKNTSGRTHYTSLTNVLLGLTRTSGTPSYSKRPRFSRDRSLQDGYTNDDNDTIAAATIATDTTPFPPGHPLLLSRELATYSVKGCRHQSGDLSRILDSVPVFLKETAQRNASWLAKLRSSVDVDVYVERLIPVEAVVQWLPNRDTTDVCPPGVVRGEDLAHLKIVHPYPHINYTSMDIGYLQLDESDMLYDLDTYTSPEQLLYHWLTGNQTAMDSAKSAWGSPDRQTLFTDTTNPPMYSAVDTECQPQTPNIPAQTPDCAAKVENDVKTTPFWAQRALLSSARRRCRVLSSAKHRMTYDDLSNLADEYLPRFQIYVPDGDNEDEVDATCPDKSNSKTLKIREAAVGETPIDAAALTHDSDKSEDHLEALIKTREANLPPPFPGTWVAVGLHATRRECNVRWQDGSLEHGICCADLLPVYFDIDEHDVFPGALVSLSTAVTKQSFSSDVSPNVCKSSDTEANATHHDTQPSDLEECFTEYPRDYGIVLSANPKERTCLVQWFRKETADEVQDLIPIGVPEDVGLYELTMPRDLQLSYGGLHLMHVTNEREHANIPAAFIEDIIPQPNKVLVHWIDGTKSKVTRQECLLPLTTFLEDGDSSSDEEDTIDSEQLTSDYDSEWDTASESSSYVVETASHHVIDQPLTTPHDDALRHAADKVCQAYSRTEAVRRLFTDRRAFVFWILRRFVNVPNELNIIIDHLGTLLATAALSSLSASTLDSITIPEPPMHIITPMHLVRGGDQVATDVSTDANTRVVVGEVLTPAKPWNFAEEHEALLSVEQLHSVRQLIREAYQLVHDFRIRKLYCKCDHRELLSEKLVKGVLRSIEIEGASSVLAGYRVIEEKVSTSPRTVSQHLERQGTQNSVNDLQAESARTTITGLPLQNAVNADLSSLKTDCKKVMIVPDSCSLFATSDKNWHSRVHYFVLTDGASKEANNVAYMIVSSNLFTRLSCNLASAHNHFLEQLVEFGDRALAWLSEVAPERLNKLRRISHMDFDYQTIDDATGVNAPPNVSTTVELQESTENDASTTDALIASLTPHPEDDRRESQLITVDEIPAKYRGEFIVEDAAPITHRFYNDVRVSMSKPFHKAWKRDTTLLFTSLPRGIIVKSFADRMDLYSVLIIGPAGTPYEHGLFLFDIHLSPRYPIDPPMVHYYSFANERVNPNLYVDGHVCLSLIGTWAGVDSENWDPEKSNMLQLVVSLQGLILNSQPYYNEAGFEVCRGTSEAAERSRVYNESVVATLVQSMIRLLQNPVPVFRNEILQHFRRVGDAYSSLLEFWATLDENEYKILSEIESSTQHTQGIGDRRALPEFPLPPVSKGFQISVRRNRMTFLKLVSSTKLHDTVS